MEVILFSGAFFAACFFVWKIYKRRVFIRTLDKRIPTKQEEDRLRLLEWIDDTFSFLILGGMWLFIVWIILGGVRWEV